MNRIFLVLSFLVLSISVSGIVNAQDTDARGLPIGDCDCKYNGSWVESLMNGCTPRDFLDNEKCYDAFQIDWCAWNKWGTGCDEGSYVCYKEVPCNECDCDKNGQFDMDDIYCLINNGADPAFIAYCLGRLFNITMYFSEAQCAALKQNQIHHNYCNNYASYTGNYGNYGNYGDYGNYGNYGDYGNYGNY